MRYLVILATILLLAACGGDDDDATEAPQVTQGASTATVATSNTPASSDSGTPTVADANTPAAAAATATNAPEATAGSDVLSIGDSAPAGNFIVTVNSFAQHPGGVAAKPEAGNIFVIVDVTMENTGSETANASSVLMWHFRDDTGQEYNLSIGAVVGADGHAPDGQITAGELFRGQLGYEVPETATGFTLQFDSTGFGGDIVRWELGEPTP